MTFTHPFKHEATDVGSAKWQTAASRIDPLYQRESEIRSPFARDYTRILHSTAYRRLKYKTQVFFEPENDHICTRIDHVHYVESLSRLIAEYLGLNPMLATAIALGHDLGHPPLGHEGERILNAIMKEEGLDFTNAPAFWHARSGLHYVDDLEILSGYDGRKHNLNLTYAVRDGIIAHSGSVSKPIRPREQAIDLSDFNHPGEYEPYTWEGCIVKIADNISYLGRDIDDAYTLDIIGDDEMHAYNAIIRTYAKGRGGDIENTNNSNVIHLLVSDLCAFSTPKRGIGFSEEGQAAMSAVLSLNRQFIYHNDILTGYYKKNGEHMLRAVYGALKTIAKNPSDKAVQARYPVTSKAFFDWLANYTDAISPRKKELANRVIYHAADWEREYPLAVIDYLAGMTDRLLTRVYREITR